MVLLSLPAHSIKCMAWTGAAAKAKWRLTSVELGNLVTVWYDLIIRTWEMTRVYQPMNLVGGWFFPLSLTLLVINCWRWHSQLFNIIRWFQTQCHDSNMDLDQRWWWQYHHLLRFQKRPNTLEELQIPTVRSMVHDVSPGQSSCKSIWSTSEATTRGRNSARDEIWTWTNN